MDRIARVPWSARIRARMMVLHTAFSLALALILLVALHPPISELVKQSESRQAALAAALALRDAGSVNAVVGMDGVTITRGEAGVLDIAPAEAERARESSGTPIRIDDGAIAFDADSGAFIRADVGSVGARAVITKIYLLLTVSLLLVYGLIVLTLEVFVLPGQVYRPIQRLLEADEAVLADQRERELVPESLIPDHELGQIMRSRNATVELLRDKEHELSRVLGELEEIASELKKKNHLLETARRNLTDQDRLVSLGMLSAGIAHELNTPLAVAKGCAEQLRDSPDRTLPPAKAALLYRVVARLERLSESLLDFARARKPVTRPFAVAHAIEEAWTLVSLDRDAQAVTFELGIDRAMTVPGDADRMTQVFVNLLRNAVDALDGHGVISASASEIERDGRRWASIVVRDNGPGIEPTLFPRLFEPFASTRYDADGTGLGLAVAEGIVKEHGGLLVARNAPDRGAIFETLLPIDADVEQDAPLFEQAAQTGSMAS